MKRALALVIGLAVVASACSGSDGGDTTTTAVATTAVESSTTSTAGPASTTSSAPTTTAVATTTTSKVPPTTASGVFLATDLVWEGQTQTITLYDDGLLVAGSAQGQADFSPEEYEWITPSATLEVIELGASQHPEALLLTTPVDEAEDPPNRTQLFVSDGKLLRRILNQSYGVYNVTELDFLGDGTFEYTEDGWTACGRLDFPETTVVQEVVTVGLTDGAEMSEIGRRPSELTQDCNNLAACPYVYVLGVEGEELIGEILRNVRGRDAYTTQGLELPTQHGLLHIQLREEKEEVTYLDAIALLVDGEKILPRACGDGSDLGHCSIDGISLRLDEGDVLDLWFEVPPGATSLELNATGYYVPTPKS